MMAYREEFLPAEVDPKLVDELEKAFRTDLPDTKGMSAEEIALDVAHRHGMRRIIDYIAKVAEAREQK
jgi:hypothetical protein